MDIERLCLLLVEDDEIDVLTFKRALKEIHLVNQLYIASDGEEALMILRDSEQSTPCLILLDLNMPRMTGLEFLKLIKQDDVLKQIPVIILTTSKDERDKIESFKLGVAGYMVKPVDYHHFVEVVRTIDLYWTRSELP
jgi:CheY-like chemotaxis protein